MQGGRLSALRAVVEADIERSSGSSGALERSIATLEGRERIGHREADLYALHVLVKAILEDGDTPAAVKLAHQLGESPDDEERLYAVWLRAWFDFDVAGETGGGDGGDGRADESTSEKGGLEDDAPWAPLSDGDIRLAALLARAHGAEKLVEKLETLERRVPAIARDGGEG